MRIDFNQKAILVADLHNFGLNQQLFPSLTNSRNCFFSNDADSARELFTEHNPNLVIMTLEPLELQGMQFLNWLQQQGRPLAIIAATLQASAELSAAAIRSGATDILDLSQEEVVPQFERRIRRSLALIEEQDVLNDLGHPLFDESQQQFLGSSPAMQEVSRLIINAAKSNASVFITGENGTGKEVCSQLIHSHSNRKSAELVTLNCAAIPANLAESELFGHVKGAFTGATADRKGVASLAHQSTLFLDEIGEMGMDVQSKLLRFVQTGVFNPVGSNHYNQVDVRFVCATNRDPHQQIVEGTFRQDLFYRLNVIQIHLPPLRERGQDILVLARRFLQQFSQEEGKQFEGLSPETENLLLSYSWPGNIRELQNIMRNVAVLYDSDTVIPSMLPMTVIREKGDRRKRAQSQPDSSRNQVVEKRREKVQAIETGAKGLSSPGEIRPLDEVIEESISRAIELCDGNIPRASHALGVSPSTLYRRLKN